MSFLGAVPGARALPWDGEWRSFPWEMWELGLPNCASSAVLFIFEIAAGSGYKAKVNETQGNKVAKWGQSLKLKETK